jgi:hypothetical protein
MSPHIQDTVFQPLKDEEEVMKLVGNVAQLERDRS